MDVWDTRQPIRHRSNSAKDLPARGRLASQLELLLNHGKFTNIFEASVGTTIVGLLRESTDPQGRPDNYFRIDFQRVTAEGYLNIHYQVSNHTVACVLVDPQVENCANGLENVQEAMKLSFNSGTYPTRGKPNGGLPNYIYQIDVIEPKNVARYTPKRGKRSKKPSKHDIILRKRKPKKINKLVDDGVDLNDKISHLNKDIEGAMQSIYNYIFLKQVVASLFKLFPMLGLIVGLFLALHRFNRGEYKKSLCEVLSGAFSLVPPFGTVASIAIDIAILTTNIIESEYNIKIMKNESAIKYAEQQLADVQARMKSLGMTDGEIEEHFSKQSHNTTMIETETIETKTIVTYRRRRRFLIYN